MCATGKTQTKCTRAVCCQTHSTLVMLAVFVFRIAQFQTPLTWPGSATILKVQSISPWLIGPAATMTTLIFLLLLKRTPLPIWRALATQFFSRAKTVRLFSVSISVLLIVYEMLIFEFQYYVTSNNLVQLYYVNMIKSIIMANCLQACVLCFCSMWSMCYQGSITCLQEVPILGLRADWTVACIDWWVAYSLLELSARSIPIKWDTETLDWYWWSEHQFRQCHCPSGAESIVWAHNSG